MAPKGWQNLGLNGAVYEKEEQVINLEDQIHSRIWAEHFFQVRTILSTVNMWTQTTCKMSNKNHAIWSTKNTKFIVKFIVLLPNTISYKVHTV